MDKMFIYLKNKQNVIISRTSHHHDEGWGLDDEYSKHGNMIRSPPRKRKSGNG